MTTGDLNTYEGSFLNGAIGGGRGKMTYKDGDVYEGEWDQGRPWGQGVICCGC